MYIKMIFVGTEEVHYLKSNLILKIDFVKTKEKRYKPGLLLPEGRFTLEQSLLVILTTIGKREYTPGILEIPGIYQHGHLYFFAGVPVVYVIYLPYTSQCPICKNFPSVLTLGRSW